MKVFLDTNVFLDMIVRRDNIGDNINAARLFELASMKEFDFFISPITVSNAFYIMRADSSASDKIQARLERIGVLPMDHSDVGFALYSGLPDKEDAMQISCAERGGCDVIVTRDARHFSESPVPVFSPVEFLSKLL